MTMSKHALSTVSAGQGVNLIWAIMKYNTFYIHTLGCKVNQYESQVIRERFLQKACKEAEDFNGAEVCVVNTCTVTSMSDAESLRLIRKAVKAGKRVVATGCLVEDKGLDLSRLEGAGFIVSNRDKYSIPDIVLNETRNRGKAREAIEGFKGHTRVFLKVQDGCNNTCSYCKVRVVRGKSRSKPLKEVISECESIIKKGAKEIVLTGICLGAYGRDISKTLNLSGLIEKICNIDGEWRLRLSSIEPKDITKDLIKIIKNQDKLCKHIHAPFQNGDNDILRKMHRPYTNKDYLKIVDSLRDAVPDIAVSTDIMVGFPGETQKNFENTVKFIEKAQPMRIHVFPFSARKGTLAYNYNDTVNIDVKKKREKELLRLAGDLSVEFSTKFIGKNVVVLIEEKRTKDGYLQGYIDRYIKVKIKGPDSFKGSFVRCPLTLTNLEVYGILTPFLV